ESHVNAPVRAGARATPPPAAACAAKAAEELLKDFLKAAKAGATRATAEAIAVHAGVAEAVVASALFVVVQHFVGFVDFLEARFRVSVFADIRVIFTSQAAERGFDFGFVGASR